MLKLKQELKISNLFLQGSVGLEGKMNDERMIPQTHQWSINWMKRENVLSRVEWYVLLLLRVEAKRENVLYHIGWCVLLLASEEVKRVREWLARPFMLPGSLPRAEWHQSFSLDEIHKFETPTAKTIPALNNDLKFFLLHPFTITK